jgi:hypothetical protein
VLIYSLDVDEAFTRVIGYQNAISTMIREQDIISFETIFLKGNPDVTLVLVDNRATEATAYHNYNEIFVRSVALCCIISVLCLCLRLDLRHEPITTAELKELTKDMIASDGQKLDLDWEKDPRLVAHLERREAHARNVHGVVCIMVS